MSEHNKQWILFTMEKCTDENSSDQSQTGSTMGARIGSSTNAEEIKTKEF